MALMSLNDTIFLELESREAPMHVGGLQLFEPPPGAGPELLAEVYARMLATTDLDDRLTRRCYRSAGGVGPWMWERDDQVDLEHHVRHSALPHPHRVRELLALVSRLHGTPLHRSRPLWEMHLIEGLERDRFAIYLKVHHAIVGTVNAVPLLLSWLSDKVQFLPGISRRRWRWLCNANCSFIAFFVLYEWCRVFFAPMVNGPCVA